MNEDKIYVKIDILTLDMAISWLMNNNIHGWYLTPDIHYSYPYDDKYYWWLIIIYSSLPNITAVKLTSGEI